MNRHCCPSAAQLHPAAAAAAAAARLPSWVLIAKFAHAAVTDQMTCAHNKHKCHCWCRTFQCCQVLSILLQQRVAPANDHKANDSAFAVWLVMKQSVPLMIIGSTWPSLHTNDHTYLSLLPVWPLMDPHQTQRQS